MPYDIPLLKKLKNSLMTYPFLGQIELDEVYGLNPKSEWY
jgi:hypothetical protein